MKFKALLLCLLFSGCALQNTSTLGESTTSSNITTTLSSIIDNNLSSSTDILIDGLSNEQKVEEVKNLLVYQSLNKVEKDIDLITKIVGYEEVKITYSVKENQDYLKLSLDGNKIFVTRPSSSEEDQIILDAFTANISLEEVNQTKTFNVKILKESSSFISNSSSNLSSNENLSSSQFNVCEDKPGGKNEDGSDKLPIPCNKNNKIKIGNDNNSMTSFEFKDSLPEYFRAIYGNNFDTGQDLFYSSNNGGGYRIKMGGPSDPSRGIQTAMFESNLKLEIRVNIGEMFNNSKGNEVDKDLPVIVIYAFDENGNYLRKAEIEEITMNNKNNYIRRYIDGSDVAYLEIRALQCAYKSSQGYNYALLGLDLIAWPYSL